MGAMTRHVLRRLARSEGGAGVVEFALVAPVLILLSIGVIEAARAVAAQAAITHATKETVRFAAVRGSASGAAATQADLETMALDVADLSSALTTAAASWAPDNAPGSVVTVQMQHDFTPLALPFGARTFSLSATASMTVVR
jgi:Flp pilus assembly protein TadG